MTNNDPSAPSFLRTAGEFLTPLELAKLVAATPTLVTQVRGSGEPVVVLPGLGAGNASTLLMRNYLAWLGYDVNGWTLGRNTGNVREFLPKIAEQVCAIYSRTEQKVNVVGWSLGGVLAREVARDHPSLVKQVIIMGSPLIGGPKYTRFGSLFEAQGANLDEIEARIADRERRPITVPITSIYSKRDGIVSWQASIDTSNSHAEHLEVKATHLGLGISPEVFKILAMKLARN